MVSPKPDDLRPPPESARLLPCPFCGGQARHEEYGLSQYIVLCGPCDCHLSPQESVEDAVNAWNRRAALTINPEDAGQVERVARELCFQRISYTKGSKDRFVWSRWIDENWIYHKTAAQATLSALKALTDG